MNHALITEIRRELSSEAMQKQLAIVLPPSITPERFVRTAMTAIQLTPKLLEADKHSLFSACMQAAQDGLLPDGREAVLNVYNTKKKDVNNRDIWVPTVQYLPMYRGLLKIMRNSGEIAMLDAAAVYAKDEFVFQRGDDPKIIHNPYLGDGDAGLVVAAYCIIKFKSGEVYREVMRRQEIEVSRMKSKSPDGLMWKDFYGQAAIKTVLKRAAKYLPASSEVLNRVIDHDNDLEGLVLDHEKPKALPRTGGRMAALIEANKKPETTVEGNENEQSNND